MCLGITPHASFNGLNLAVCFTLVFHPVSLGEDLTVRVGAVALAVKSRVVCVRLPDGV